MTFLSFSLSLVHAYNHSQRISHSFRKWNGKVTSFFFFKKSKCSTNICFLCRRSTCQRLRLISIFVAVIYVCVFVYAASVNAFNEFNDAFNFRKTSAFNSTLNRKFISWCLNFAVSVVQFERTIPVEPRRKEKKMKKTTTTKANQFIFPHRDCNHNNHTLVWSESLLVCVSWVKKWVFLC